MSKKKTQQSQPEVSKQPVEGANEPQQDTKKEAAPFTVNVKDDCKVAAFGCHVFSLQKGANEVDERFFEEIKKVCQENKLLA